MRAAALLIAALLAAPEAGAARFARPEADRRPVVLEHAFGGETPAFTLELRPIAGELRRVRGPEPRLIDLADYSDSGRLVVRRSIALGPLPQGPAIVPPGEYRVSVAASGTEGLPVLALASAGGLRLRIPMVAAPRPPERPEGLSGRSLGGDEAAVSLPLAIDLPTASGMLLVGPVEMLDESPLQRRRSRAQVIQEEMQRRAIESGHVRPLQRRERRTAPP